MVERALPIRIAFVCAPDNPVPSWVPSLARWLENDPAFALVGHLSGAPEPEAPGDPVLALERMIFNRATSQPVRSCRQSLVEALPILDADLVIDIALVVGASRLPDAARTDQLREVWSLEIGGAPARQAVVNLRQALAEGDATVPMSLRVQRAGQAEGEIVCTAHYNTKPSAIQLEAYLEDEALIFLQRALTCFRYGLPITTGAVADLCPESIPERPSRSYAGRLARTIGRRLWKRASEKLRRSSDRWSLQVAPATGVAFDTKALRDIPSVQTIMADPFLFEHNGVLYVFYEALGTMDEPAWIEVGRLDSMEFTRLGEALRCPYHLSFPFVFAHEGDVFMIPETHQTNRLEVWRATRFPFEWELHATALEGQSPADSVLFRRDHHWWLFTNLSRTERFSNHMNALYLFEVDGPEMRQITPHRLNPIVIGSNVARNGGAILSFDGVLYRPSQINARGVYGYGLNLMRIDVLDPENYHETLVRRITPQDIPGAHGVHHISFARDLVMLDVYHDKAGHAP